MPFLYAKLNDKAVRPFRKHANDAGVDVFAAEDVVIPPFSAGRVCTGISIHIPEGHAVFVWPKGGSDYIIGAGVVDAGYQGEVMVKVVNYRPEQLRIEYGTPLAQLVMQPVICEPVVEVDIDFIYDAQSERGATGGILR